MLRSLALILVFCTWFLGAQAAPAVTAGWETLTLDNGATSGLVYIPTSVDQSHPAPVAVFFHGLGGQIIDYANYLSPSAETAGLVVILVQSEDSSGGWSSQDLPAINDALSQVGAQLTLDPQRLSLCGHSAGAAFAYLLAYSDTGVNAIFTISAPVYQVTSIADTSYTAPIHMCYGDQDPNYIGGADTTLTQQWTSLGVTSESDICAGFDHNTVVSDGPAITRGFLFLVGKVDTAAGTGTTSGTGTGATTGTTGTSGTTGTTGTSGSSGTSAGTSGTSTGTSGTSASGTSASASGTTTGSGSGSSSGGATSTGATGAATGSSPPPGTTGASSGGGGCGLGAGMGMIALIVMTRLQWRQRRQRDGTCTSSP
jgi:poly(3-hydroxybutyrate) depolymerase